MSERRKKLKGGRKGDRKETTVETESRIEQEEDRLYGEVVLVKESVYRMQ